MYLAPEEGAALVRCLGRLLRCAAFVVYEQIRPNDPFGQQMVLNLQARRGLHVFCFGKLLPQKEDL